MNRFERERVDGIRDGLNIALSAAKSCTTVTEVRDKLWEAMDLAREAANRQSLIMLREMAIGGPHDPYRRA